MRNSVRSKTKGFLLLFAVVALIIAISAVACSSSKSTATPILPTPTTVAQSTVTIAAGQPTPLAPTPTRTKALPAAAPSGGSPQYGGILRYSGLETDWDTLDPAFSTQTDPRPALFSIYNNIVQLMPDGTPANAQAVKWNYDRYLDKTVGSTRRTQLQPPLDNVAVVDDTTVQFNFSTPFRPLLATLTGRSGQIVSPTAVQKDNSYSDRAGKFGQDPIGSGPFVFKSWVPQSMVDLVKNPNYWDKGKLYLDEIQFVLQSDKTVKFAMLRTGEVDLIQGLTAADAQLAKQNPNVVIIEQAGTSFRMLRFRLTEDPWTNHDLIAAMAYAIDRDSLVKVLYQGYASPAYSPIGPAYGTWFDSSIQTYAYNTQKAKDMLTQVGDPNGFSYTQYCSSTTFDIQWCETLQAMFSQVGIKMDIQNFDSKTYWGSFVSGKFNVVESYISPRADPYVNLQRMYTCKGYSNSTGMCIPQVDNMLDQSAQTYDVSKAKDLYDQAITLIIEQGTDIFTVYETNLDGERYYVRNYKQRLDNVARLKDIWLSKH